MTNPRSSRIGSLFVLLLAVAAPILLLQLFPIGLPEFESRPLASRGAAKDGPRFRRVPSAESGLRFQNELKKENRYTYLTNGAGLAAGDYDKDGLPDLYCVSQDGPNRLYRQVAPMQFEDVTARAGNVDGGEAWGSGACFVDVDGDSLGQPVDEAHARAMLQRLSGRAHRVHTGVCVIHGSREESAVTTTLVEMHPLDDATLERYITTGEPMGKAGAYAIQGEGAILVARHVGSLTGVIGLPLETVSRLVGNLGLGWN